MLVSKSHKTFDQFDQGEIASMSARCSFVASQVFPGQYFKIDSDLQHWDGHLHWHIFPIAKFGAKLEETE